MVGERHESVIVAPFECAWREELRFREAGRGCVAFEASAKNDVTLVFREQVGSQQYHYKRDNCPNYTVILGSHRNRRLKIEVDGKSVVDISRTGLCSSNFQSYWISVYDGLICIGKGKHPSQNIVFQWLDSKPNCTVQYVGLCSWDKHVGYRNVVIFSVAQHHKSLWSHIDYKENEEEYDEYGESEYMTGDHERPILMNFLESWDLADIVFIVGDEMSIPAHMVILNCHGDFSSTSSDSNIIQLPSTTYPTLHALLEYVYTGRTQIVESQLGMLWNLSLKFQVLALSKQMEEMIDTSGANQELFGSGKIVEIKDESYEALQSGIFACEVPVVRKLKQFLTTGKYSDVNIYIEGHDLIARSHKLILSLWSAPFAKMFTNGMVESTSQDVFFKDVSVKVFLVMLQFMYSGELEIEKKEVGSLLIPLLILADQFGVTSLQRECCKCLVHHLSEDTVCPILQAVSAIPSCKMLEETCKRNFSMQFDYYTTASTEFLLLDEAIFKDILQHADMTVTSEEKVLDAILVWCMQDSQICGWAAIEELLQFTAPEQLFRARLSSLDVLLPFVRFPLMAQSLLQKLEKSELCNQVPVFEQLVKEAIQNSSTGPTLQGTNQNARFRHRPSSFKEFQYLCHGDSNGVIFYAGTSYGKHQWVNPVLSKKIIVTASSPASRFTDPKALVSRAYHATSFAGPRVEDGQNCAWWMVDLGQDHQLMCNYYTLRQDGSNAYIRSWNFQGSMDGVNWTNLREHNNDHSICKLGQFASWPVIGPTALLPFRFFRVILVAPGTSNSWNFCICYIELYGFFR